VGAALLLASVCYYLVISLIQPRMMFPSIPFFITAGYFAPGLAFSFGVNGLVMARRRARIIRPAERVLVLIEFVVAALLVISALIVDQQLLGGIAFDLSLLLWAAVIPLAVAILAVELTPVRSSAPTRPPVRRR
jgi:peptidoglycan/LPS O-acetylase OafA/YrhL